MRLLTSSGDDADGKSAAVLPAPPPLMPLLVDVHAKANGTLSLEAVRWEGNTKGRWDGASTANRPLMTSWMAAAMGRVLRVCLNASEDEDGSTGMRWVLLLLTLTAVRDGVTAGDVRYIDDM